MARVSPKIHHVGAGEISPRLRGRSDLDWFKYAARRLENMIALPWGPAQRRPATRFIAEVKDSAKATVVRPFEFNDLQAYTLEIGDQYMRFYRDKGRIEVAGVPVELATPWLEAEIHDVMWVQSADVIYLVHPSHAPRKVTRTSHTAWTINIIDFVDGPYLEENADSSRTLQPSAVSGAGITITAAGFTPFVATDVGRLVRINHGGTWGYAKIVGFTDTSHVTADVKSNFGGTTASSSWRLGQWSDTTGWPSAVIFHQERLWFGKDDWLSMSVTGDFENFTPGANADDAGSFRLAANKPPLIRWLASSRVLLVGTLGQEFAVGPVDSPITPTSIQIKAQTFHGSARLTPIAISSVLLFVQRQLRKIRQLIFSFDQDAYNAPDLTLRAEHITKSGILDISYAEEPFGVVWAALGSGGLAAMTLERDEKVLAWHRHPLGGANVVVESVSVIPSASEDEVWLVVSRTIDGATRRYIEAIDPYLADDAPQEDAFFVDCGLSYDGAATTVFAGLDHLEGETVNILADGAERPQQVVTGGQITLATAASKVHVGLPYRWLWEPAQLDAGAQDGSATGKQQRIGRLAIQLYRTLGVKIGRADDKLDELFFREVSDPMDAAPPLFTGVVTPRFPGDTEKEAPIILAGDGPFPATIVSITPRLTVGDG